MSIFNVFKNKTKKADIFIKEIKQEDSFSEAKTLTLGEKEKVIQIADIYLEKYNQLLETFFNTAFEMNPQAFRLSNEENVKLIHYTINKQLIPRYGHGLAFIYNEDSNLQYESLDLTTPVLYSNYGEYQHDHLFIEDLLKDNLQVKLSDIIFWFDVDTFMNTPKINSTESFKDTMSIYGSTMLEQMKTLIRNEGTQYQKHVNQPSEYYAKNAARYSYSLLDLSPILEKVNDEDFAYQLDQAIAAYDNSLYLASCATLGVCLETLCKILLKENGEKIKDSDGTMLNALAQKLREKNYISYKFASRIDVCYKVRNLASHTSPGKVVQNDCHFILNTIHEIVDVYF